MREKTAKRRIAGDAKTRAQRTESTRSIDERRQRVLATVDSVPRGSVASYGQIALEASMPGRARWVGRVLGELAPGSKLAWHRVINSAGKISFPKGSRHELEQRRRLRREGIEFRPSGAIDLARFGWRP